MIKLSQEDQYIHLSLNRPEKRNALNTELMSEFIKTLEKLSSDLKDNKFLLITGEGKSFCAGADLNWMKQMASFTFEENKKDSEILFKMFNSIYDFPLPVITYAHGHVYGGGLGLLAAADYVVASPDTKYSFSEVKLGLAPSVISTFVLNSCSTSQARALMTSGEVFGQGDALKLGLSNKTEDISKTTLTEVIKSYQSSSQEALIACKNLIKQQVAITPSTHKNLVVETISKLRVSDEAQKRMNNFLKNK